MEVAPFILGVVFFRRHRTFSRALSFVRATLMLSAATDLHLLIVITTQANPAAALSIGGLHNASDRSTQREGGDVYVVDIDSSVITVWPFAWFRCFRFISEIQLSPYRTF